MSEWALFWGAAAMLCAAYALLGGFLEWIWGVNSTRKTAGSMRGGGIAFLMVLHVIACAAYGASAGTQMAAQLGKPGALIAVMFGCAVVYPILGFSVLFASVRHDGEGLAAIAQRLYGAAGKVVTQVFIVLASALVACTPSNSMIQLGLLQTLALSQVIAPRIKNEAYIRITAFAGMVASGISACVMLLNLEIPMLVREAFVWACLICGIWSICVMMNVGMQALLGLMRGNGIRRKESGTQKLLAIVCMLILWMTITYLSWQFDFPFVAVFGILMCLGAGFLCAVWMKHIGRGLFSRN